MTLVECALQLLRRADLDKGMGGPGTSLLRPSGGIRPSADRDPRRRTKLLLAAPQNYSADLIASSLAAALGDRAGGGRLLRLNDPRRCVAVCGGVLISV